MYMNTFVTSQYQLHWQDTQDFWNIHFHIKAPLHTTANLPGTQAILKSILPSVITTDCFNAENLPFSQELQKTETAHLFEHILLDYLCREAIHSGAKSAEFIGRTYWSSSVLVPQDFEIKIGKAPIEEALFKEALSKSCSLLNIIILSGIHGVPLPSSTSVH